MKSGRCGRKTLKVDASASPQSEPRPSANLPAQGAERTHMPATAPGAQAFTGSLRRWLPRQLRTGVRTEPALGYVRGSLLWLVILIQALVTSVAGAGLNSTILDTPEPAQAPAKADADVCRDRAGFDTLGEPLSAADAAIRNATTSRTALAALEARRRVAAGVIRDVARYETASSWGADIKPRLIAALKRTVRADQALLDGKIDQQMWLKERDELHQVADDLVAPIC